MCFVNNLMICQDYTYQVFFHDFTCTNDLSHQYSKLHVKSEWTSPLAPPWIELPLSVITLELCSLCNHLDLNFSSNLSRSELSALCKLCSIKGVRILAADKNLGPTIVTDFWYKEEVSRLIGEA